MNLLKFLFFSFMEYCSTFIFILIQFRFNYKENIAKITLISILLSFVSYSLINANLEGISPLVQIVIFFVYVQMVLKISIINSIIMVLTGYIVFGLVQTCILALVLHSGMDIGEMKRGTSISYQIQVYSSLAMLLFAALTTIFKGGFSFIESHGRFSRKLFTGKNRWFIVYIIISLVITMYVNILLLLDTDPPFLLIALILMVMLLFQIYLTLRRDELID
jgi:hypothetical protein